MVEMKVFNNVVEKQTHKKFQKLMKAVIYKMNLQWYFTIMRFYDYFQEAAV